MVGSRFCELFKNQKNLIKADLKGENNIDITSSESVNDFFKRNDFDVAILFSAYTDVDRAETERDNKNGICWKINVEGLTNIVETCKKTKRKLVFISTDFVFDGEKGPYNEDAKRGGDPAKISWYGITKIRGEETVETLEKDYIIVRISYPYRSSFPKKEDFARQILKRFDEGTLYPMFTDQVFTPSFIDDIPEAFEFLIQNRSSGIFHIVSPNSTTPYDFAYELLRTFGKDSSILKKGSLADFLKIGDKAPRPLNSAMLTTKIQYLGYKPTDWREGIEKIFAQSKN